VPDGGLAARQGRDGGGCDARGPAPGEAPCDGGGGQLRGVAGRAGPRGAAAGSAGHGKGAAAPSCAGWTDVQPPNPDSYPPSLNAVAVLSSTNAWAVGSYDPLNGDPTVQLIDHWDGSRWHVLGLLGGALTSVAAVSRTNVWVAGYSYTRGLHGFIEHREGTGWKQVALPRHSGLIYGLAAISAANIWAVGEAGVLHWNGTTWKHVRTPVPGGVLLAVDASSPTHVWAVGYSGGTPAKTLVLRWNGARWKHVPSPNPGTSLSILDSVTAISRDNVWAAGYDASVVNGPRRTLIEHWNGARWKHVPSPSPGNSDTGSSGSVLTGVAASSASSVWAVGGYSDGTGTLTLIARWNGTAWKQVPSPNPAGTSAFHSNALGAVSAASASNVWAVGSWLGTPGAGVLAIHHC
jgi:hypothetical protein